MPDTTRVQILPPHWIKGATDGEEAQGWQAVPTLRLLADNASALGSHASRDVDGAPVFSVAPGNTVALALDFTGWLGLSDTLTGSAWVSDLTLSGEANSGGVASALAVIPDAPIDAHPDAWPIAYAVTHTATASGGRVRVTRFFLNA